MCVIYQIHDFCVNNFHYYNVADDDYHSYSHYQTSVIACEVAVEVLGRNLTDQDQTGGDCSATIPRNHQSCFDDDNVDEIEAAVELMAGSRNRLASEVKWVPRGEKIEG